jgi:XTP/dITP diphosphohydrolase
VNQTPDPRADAFLRLLKIMDELRAQCPWDKEQTNASLRHLTLEETYELSEAILANDAEEIKKELGDLLLHIVFYAKIGSEEEKFDITSVIHSLCEKLIHRHPHIYGDTQVSGSDQVKENWEQLKLKEKKGKRVLEGVPAGLPALVKAIRIQDKAASAGFDWEEKEQVWEKLQEELQELQQAVQGGETPDRVEEELGDLIFSAVNYARFIGVNPEDALENTNRKFIRRFAYVENQAIAAGKNLKDLSLAEMDAWWDEIKKIEKSGKME